MTFKYGFTTTGKDYEGKMELIFTDGPYQDVAFIMDGMKFADEENDDGTINMSFDYEVTNGKEVDENFGPTVGEMIHFILEEQVKNKEVIYKGGEGETEVISD